MTSYKSAEPHERYITTCMGTGLMRWSSELKLTVCKQLTASGSDSTVNRAGQHAQQ